MSGSSSTSREAGSKLQNFLHSILSAVLSEKLRERLGERFSIHYSHSLAATIVEQLSQKLQAAHNSGSSAAFSRELSDYGRRIAQFLKEDEASAICDDLCVKGNGVNIEGILSVMTAVKSKNQMVFRAITSHHQSLSLSTTVNGSSGAVTDIISNVDKTALETYSIAATEMGMKSWVSNGHVWMEQIIVSYFCGDLARQTFIKTCRQRHLLERNGVHISKDHLHSIRSLLGSNPICGKTSSSSSSSSATTTAAAAAADDDDAAGAPSSTYDEHGGDHQRHHAHHHDNNNHYPHHHSRYNSKVRLIDVGSCYNPFASCASAALFDVTALDLCPSSSVAAAAATNTNASIAGNSNNRSSVFVCDFLNVLVGCEQSATCEEPNGLTVSEECRGIDNAAALADITDKIHDESDNAEAERGGSAKRRKKETPARENATEAAPAATVRATVLARATSAPHLHSNIPKGPPALHVLPANADVVVMSLVLSYLPSAAMRCTMVSKARQLLLDPIEDATCSEWALSKSAVEEAAAAADANVKGSCSHSPPHRCGLLVIFEKQSALSTRLLLNNWVAAVEQRGFALVRYQHVHDARSKIKAHGFVFKTTGKRSIIRRSSGSVLLPLNIKQDTDVEKK